MAHPSDVVIGLDAGPRAITAVAATPDGAPVGSTSVAHTILDGGTGMSAEQDMGETWQRTLQALRRLADRVPDLARRTQAVGITGQIDGTWLVDEDGDPVGPAILGLDGRAAPLVATWRTAGIAAPLHRRTGTPPCAALQNAQLAWLKARQPERLAHVAAVLDAKSWLYGCLTGERAREASDAVPSFGEVRSSAYDDDVLEAIGLADMAALLPPLTGPREVSGLGMAASAATGLAEGTPAALAPPSPFAAALAAGLAPDAGPITVVVLDDEASLVRLGRDPDRLRRGGSVGPEVSSGAAVVPSPFARSWFEVVHSQNGAACLDWVVDLAEQILADAGLIGVRRADLAALFEARVADRPPSDVLLVPFFAPAGERGPVIDPDARGRITGLRRQTSLYDLMWGAYAGLGQHLEACRAALGTRSEEIRLVGGRGDVGFLRRTIAASTGCPIRAVEVSSPGAAAALGAALFATHATDAASALDAMTQTWSAPLLGEPEPPDPALAHFSGP